VTALREGENAAILQDPALMARVCLSALLCVAPDALLGQTHVHRDWTVECVEASKPECIAVPAVQSIENVQIYIVDDGAGAVLVVRTPLGVLLGEGILLSVDGAQIGRLGFQICEESGCVAPLRLQGTPLRAMQRGTEMTVTVLFQGTGAQQTDVSLLGFSAALRALAGDG
jgi:invasion protein IalB